MTRLSPVKLEFQSHGKKPRLGHISLVPLDGLTKDRAVELFQTQFCRLDQQDLRERCPANGKYPICEGMGCDGRAKVHIQLAGGMLAAMPQLPCMHDEHGCFRLQTKWRVEVV